MFAAWGRLVVRGRWVVLAAAVGLEALGVLWGSGVFGQLTGGGFDDPASESSRARARAIAEIGVRDVDVIVLYSSATTTVTDPAFRDAVAATLATVRGRPEVADVTSWFDTQAPGLVATDGRATYALVRLVATEEDAKTAAFETLRPALIASAPGIETQLGGNMPFLVTANELTSQDLARAETLSLPVLLVLLVIIFGGLVAAAMPLLIGGLAILGALVAIRVLTWVTDVSIFSINVITLIGLGLAIDYALFVLGRFREELAAGHPVPAAIERTMATAGRTVLVSGLTIALALASLLIFPQVFMRSIGYGGTFAVLVAMVAALTVLPALLAVLGPRVNALRIPLRVPWRRRRAATEPSTVDGAWARIARVVMRRPVLFAAGVTAVLMLLAVPFLGVRFGGFDERVLPEGAEPRVVADRIRTGFPGGSIGPIDVLVSGGGPAAADQVVTAIAALPDVTGVGLAASRNGSTLLTVTYRGEPTSEAAQDLVRRIRALPEPAGSEILVGGRPAADLDLLASLGGRLPWMVALMASSTLILLFLAFGSILLPVKAVLMNAISIGASFGVVVWVFQDGHLADLLAFTPTGFIEPSNPIIMLAALFGLATDYEVFLLSRVREAWDASGDNTASVASGLQRTGRVITAAALLLVVVVAGFATGGIQFIKLIGVGMIVAIVVDATLVRLLLVPATMRLLGRWNWWAPGPLGRLYRRYGLRESA
jgi:trehalose monomycolate/heme transporter